MLRESMWRIHSLPDLTRRIISATTIFVTACIVLANAPYVPWQICVGAVVVGCLPALNQILRARTLHSDEPQIADTRRKTWYQDWSLRIKEGLRELLLLNAQPQVASMVADGKNEIQKRDDRRDWKFMLREMITSPAGVFLTVGSTYYMWDLHAKTRGAADAVSAGDVTFVLTTLLLLLLTAIRSFGQTAGSAFESSPFFKVFQDLSKPVPALAELPALAASARADEGKSISLEDVTFNYGKKELYPDTLRGISLDIPPGAFIALVGPIGAGKTTLFQLLCGLQKPTGGKVFINGKQLCEENRKEWVNDIGFVFQDPYPFDSLTIKKFLLLGNPGVDADFFDSILEVTGVKQVIDKEITRKDGSREKKFPLGLDTPLGEEFEGGKKLSGGEKQLFAIARAFLRKPSVLFLDEATANLNPTQRQKIVYLIQNREKILGYKPTVVAVSHNLASIKESDLILYLDEQSQGILERGKHAVLLDLNGQYAQQWKAEQESG